MKDSLKKCKSKTCAFHGDTEWCKKCWNITEGSNINGWNNVPNKSEVIQREHIYVPDDEAMRHNTYT